MRWFSTGRCADVKIDVHPLLIDFPMCWRVDSRSGSVALEERRPGGGTRQAGEQGCCGWVRGILPPGFLRARSVPSLRTWNCVVLRTVKACEERQVSGHRCQNRRSWSSTVSEHALLVVTEPGCCPSAARRRRPLTFGTTI